MQGITKNHEKIVLQKFGAIWYLFPYFLLWLLLLLIQNTILQSIFIVAFIVASIADH